MEIVEVHSKKEFQQLLREDFIPYMNSIGLNEYVKNSQKEMFTIWNICFYNNKIIKLCTNIKH